MAEYNRPIPKPVPETEEFWAGLKQGEFRLQRCNDASCATVIFPPRPFCPGCGSREVSTFVASGKGTLHSYVINHRPAPGFEDIAPYGICVVKLDEGPKLMTHIIGVEQTPEALQLDMRVELAPTPVNDEISLPTFRPVGG